MATQPFTSDGGFNSNGNITIAGNIVGITTDNPGLIAWLGNSSGDGNGYTTLELIPDSTLVFADQYIILDPTVPGHIHIRAGGDPDNSQADLILGGETSHVKVAAGLDPDVFVRSNDYQWRFDNTGNLTLPSNAFAVNYANGTPVQLGLAPSVDTIISADTITPAATNTQFNVLDLGESATVAAPSGAAVDGAKLTIRIRDSGVGQALTWDAIYRVIGTTLPTTTVANKIVYVGCIYNESELTWDVVSVAQQA